jgi:hypothetical protein
MSGEMNTKLWSVDRNYTDMLCPFLISIFLRGETRSIGRRCHIIQAKYKSKKFGKTLKKLLMKGKEREITG